jgi:lipopolysaccharide transport system ATP-binding protein
MKAFLTLLRQVALQRTTGAQEAGSGEIFYALSDIDFDVPAGEVLGVIGRNGAGKSTLLKILARTLNPTAGRIELRGRVVSLLELGIGFAPDLSLHENIQIHGRLAGFSAAAIDAAEGRILEFSRLEKYRDSLLERCPSGSFVRLAFSAMINLHADILLADEVLTVGDSDFRMQCEERIKDVGRSGQSVLFVSHDMNAIRRICTRVLWLDKGRIRMVGPTNAVVDTYTTELMAGRLLPAASSGSRSSTIIDLRLLDSDRSQTGALQMTKSAYVECIVRIDQPGATVFLEIELWNNKSHVFTTRPHQPLTAPSRATFRTSFLIPAHFLNEATYQLRARILVPDFSNIDGDLTIESEERLDFTAFNADPEQSVWADWQWGRSGIVSPRLHWSLKMQS